jgi:UDP-N-acetylglucosamine--N-acetylmuramyl-(pentapeptide) pyrophosphoryl-undecaprenol N-acetylglucosamine transferase
MSNAKPTILYAGGGTGGHIFPSIAIHERVRDLQPTAQPHFLTSQRPLDAQIMADHHFAFTPLPAKPMNIRPWRWPAIYQAWQASMNAVDRIIVQHQPIALVAMGGFVAAPAAKAARRRGLPVLLVNLDAVPGRANRYIARLATESFTAYPVRELPAAPHVGVPLRKSALATLDPAAARQKLGLAPDRDTLLVTGASQGARSINQFMQALAIQQIPRDAMRQWQIFHLAGDNADDIAALKKTYAQQGIPAVVQAFTNDMGLAWSAATLAISRAGAGSVAEVWASATPTIFLPYPYHKDQHQRLNAEPLVKDGGAVMFEDLIDAEPNVRQLASPLVGLMQDPARRQAMAKALRDHQPPDGALAAAQWLTRLCV